MMNAKGFTIIEVLVSIILFAVALAGGAGFFLHLKEVSIASTHLKLGTALASAGMERLRHTDYDLLTNGTLSNVVIGGFNAVPQVLVYDRGIYEEVHLSVTWWEPARGRNETVNLVSYIGNSAQ
jgi:prepilin-type N-terminal cleavage/methylation domain-containing protein